MAFPDSSSVLDKLQSARVSGSEIAAPNHKSLATFHRSLKSQCSIAVSCLGIRYRFLRSAMGIAIANRKNRCAKIAAISVR